MGINSPTTMVTTVSGKTTKARARAPATPSERPRLVTRAGASFPPAPAPPTAAAVAPTRVIPSWTTARLASMLTFMCKADFAPRRPSSASLPSWVRVTEARAISYAAKTPLKPIIASIITSSRTHMGWIPWRAVRQPRGHVVGSDTARCSIDSAKPGKLPFLAVPSTFPRLVEDLPVMVSVEYLEGNVACPASSLHRT